MLSSHQATISDAEDFRNLDSTIVNNQGLEISRKQKGKCIENRSKRQYLSFVFVIFFRTFSKNR